MGTSWKGLCPFHQEKTPSFNVRSEPPVFHCFGCGEGGDVFKFVMLHERVCFPEAIELVARRFGVPVPENRYEGGADRKEREEMLGLLEAAAQHFTRTCGRHPASEAREYLLGRGFKKETLERIRAGAARETLDGPARRPEAPASRRRPSDGRAGPPEGRAPTGYYDRFRNRAMFPILNEGGKVVAFGARSLDGSEPKYLNSPETPVYQKSRMLYGLSWAKDAIRKDGRAVLMEGYLDVARALEAGVEGGGGHLRHRADAGARPPAASVHRQRGRELRPGRGGAEGGAQEPRRAARGGPRGPGRGAARGPRPRQLPEGSSAPTPIAGGWTRRPATWSG